MSFLISWRLVVRVLLVLAGVVALLFALGYQLPGADQHPSWPELPRVTNARFVVEELDELTFDKRYGSRFRLPREFHDMSRSYADSLRNIRLLGQQVMSNKFKFNLEFSGPDSGAGFNSTGVAIPYPTPTRRFSQRGYTYFELTLGHEKAYFKGSYYSPIPPLEFFYQYNYPASERDTLFFYCTPNNYRVYLR